MKIAPAAAAQPPHLGPMAATVRTSANAAPTALATPTSGAPTPQDSFLRCDQQPRPPARSAALRPLDAAARQAAARVRCRSVPEIGVISDLDKTVIPPHQWGTPLPAQSYPGVAALYHALEFGDGGSAGDIHYVTARTDERLIGVARWLAAHGLPRGTIDSGAGSDFAAAAAEKVRDMQALLDAHPAQRFVLIGDTNHVDYAVMQTMIERNPGRIAAACIHDVKAVAPELLAGLFVFDDYAQVAAHLLSIGILNQRAARAVMRSAQREGLAISDEAIELRLAAAAPAPAKR